MRPLSHKTVDIGRSQLLVTKSPTDGLTPGKYPSFIDKRAVSNMDFPNASCKVTRGYTYAYIHITPADPSKPYILVLHGFPSLPVDHHSQITHLSSLGYGVVAPYLLGYGDTSHPDDKEAYRLKPMAQDVVDVLDHLSIPTVLGIGHDWGVMLLTRLEFYHPERVSKIVLEAIGCPPFGQPFDVDMVNNMMKAKLGYAGFGYMVFFTRDPDAPQILDAHQESFRDLMFKTDGSSRKDYFGAIGGLRKWLEEDRRVEKQEHALVAFTDGARREHESAFACEKGGYAATLNWYHCHVSNANVPDEQAELKARGVEAYRVEEKKPVLLLLGAYDEIAIAAMQKQMSEPYAPHAKVENMNASHWLMLEDPDNVNRQIEEFFAA